MPRLHQLSVRVTSGRERIEPYTEGSVVTMPKDVVVGNETISVQAQTRDWRSNCCKFSGSDCFLSLYPSATQGPPIRYRGESPAEGDLSGRKVIIIRQSGRRGWVPHFGRHRLAGFGVGGLLDCWRIRFPNMLSSSPYLGAENTVASSALRCGITKDVLVIPVIASHSLAHCVRCQWSGQFVTGWSLSLPQRGHLITPSGQRRRLQRRQARHHDRLLTVVISQ